MEGIIGQAARLLRAAGRRETESERTLRARRLLEEMDEIRAELEGARCRFDQVTEDGLVESAIYEMGSLESRYGYLLRQARQSGVTKERRRGLWSSRR